MEKFIARYTNEKGITKSFSFDKSRYNQERAEEELQKRGIKNFFFFFEPLEPKPFQDGMFFSGEVGFDITMDNMMPYIEEGKAIYLDSLGGDLWEGWKIHDAIKLSGLNPKITALGSVASSAVQIFLSTPIQNRYMTEQSRMLIHNPWAYEIGDDEAMREAAKSLSVEKMRLADFYSKESGRPIDYILNLMKEERFIHYEEVSEMNFINSQTIKNENEMTEEQEKRISGIEKTLNSIKSIFVKPEVKNIVLQDVNGTELDFGEIETKEQISIGVTATVDGVPANGEYVMPDGVTYVFENGSLMEIIESSGDDEMTALQEENAALKEQISELQNSISEKDKTIEGMKSERTQLESDFNKVEKDFNDFKNQFSDEKQEFETLETKDKKKKKGFTYKSKK